MAEEKNFFASNLKFLRQKQSMEQIDLAKRLGRKSSSSISEWEKGKYTPKAGVLNDIAKIFDVTLSELMSVDLPNFNNETTIIDGQLIDLRQAAANTMLFDGKPLDQDDIDFITSVLTAHFKNKNKD